MVINELLIDINHCIKDNLFDGPDILFTCNVQQLGYSRYGLNKLSRDDGIPAGSLGQECHDPATQCSDTG